MIVRLNPDTGKWLILNIAIVAVAMLALWRGARSGNGKITLCALARTMPLEVNEKYREKRLYRLLRNKKLEGPDMTPFLVLMALGNNPSPWVPIVVDQTKVNGAEVIMAGVLVARRVLPVAFCLRRQSTVVDGFSAPGTSVEHGFERPGALGRREPRRG